MKLSLRTSAIALATLLPLCIGQAHATTRFALTCLVNQTSATVGYRWRHDLPKDPWRDGRLAPGQGIELWHEYARPNENRSPRLLVNFDADTGARQYRQGYRLEAMASPDKDCQHAKKYAFVNDGKGFIDIRSQ